MPDMTGDVGHGNFSCSVHKGDHQGEFHQTKQQKQQQEQPQMLYEGSLMANDVSASSNPPAAIKKKRNFPGTPDPSAEVIALSPTTLMARNRFICEICNKGFQRDQNLQLHRRGHNLPWKLRQRSTTAELKKKVYVCPETTCVHHHPSRALGDLTGIKKHFCRKHGEKKWKCDKCSKRYAVQSDWKAHSKTCGTREYKCDCGTIFSRRDSFVTHRAFCEALAEESNKMNQQMLSSMNTTIQLHQITPVQFQTTPINANNDPSNNLNQLQDMKVSIQPSNPSFSNGLRPMSMSGMFPTVTGGSSNSGLSWSTTTTNPFGSTYTSATALLQKAAQMGSTNSSHIGVMSSSGHVPFQSHHHFAANKYGLFDEQRMEVGVGLDHGLGFFSQHSRSFDGNKKIGNTTTATTTTTSKYCDALTVDFLGRRQ